MDSTKKTKKLMTEQEKDQLAVCKEQGLPDNATLIDDVFYVLLFWFLLIILSSFLVLLFVFTFDDEDCKVSSGMSLVIPLGSKHMIRNDGKEDLIIFEMQCGVCEEDDIVRITDKYNR